ncbi:mechanosensitive ion channel family protein [Hujiaoplasma nucleasis]|uniref:Mechanosensitive ion channel family protein n=1 Tax=Hujiaoplasma nucleasis TaxID=2725268 RepID=A0A7L6MZK6_9MOLU|nr:mechanosensitive ion channel family protein [Hujiaoplasma nucleasis]QLY39423.1 mechanosensitive ion channel family protein [Hujiaoplasma nucleasis]
MVFPLPINILISLGIVVLAIAYYLLINKFINKSDDKINKLIIFVYYLIFFIIIILGLGFGFYIWGYDLKTYLQDLWATVGDGVLEKLGAIISTVIIILVSGFIVKIFRLLVRRSQKYMKTSNERRKHTILKITSSIVNYTVKIIALLLILAVWGVNVLPALAGLGILGLVVGLGAQDLIKDIIAGFFIVFEKHFDVGDMIEVEGYKGEVIDIGLKTTRVMNWKKDVKIYNNSSLRNLINYSLTESIAIVEFGIAYESDLDKTLEILAAELPKTRALIPSLIEDPVCVGVIALADSSINLRVVGKTSTEQHYGVERILRKEIKKILDAHGIEIPFPQIVMHEAKK